VSGKLAGKVAVVTGASKGSSRAPRAKSSSPPPRSGDGALEGLAAEVTITAYAVALRHGAEGSWVDLELGLWAALARTVREWGQRRPGPLPGERPPGGSGSERPQTGTVFHQQQE
jgi:hypothetical protein